jgi:hypothetical protein
VKRLLAEVNITFTVGTAIQLAFIVSHFKTMRWDRAIRDPSGLNKGPSEPRSQVGALSI